MLFKVRNVYSLYGIFIVDIILVLKEVIMEATIIRPFLPSIDFQTSKEFYLDLGFKMTYEEDKLVIFTLGSVSFFLQDAYVEDWANNTMVQLFVSDLQTFYETANSLKQKYPTIRLKEPFEAYYGRTFHLIDPAGVLWHLMQSK